MIKLRLIPIEQPIGTFYFGQIKMSDLKKMDPQIKRRSEDGGTQRQLKDKKIDDIAYYCKDPEAIFPTPIILNINSGKIIESKGNGIYTIELSDKDKAEIIDGQHRYEGIKLSKLDEINLPIVVMFNLDESEKAYIFSTINNNQTKVDKSLIYDLFGVAKDRSPYKTCHEIARMLNTDSESPLCGKIKMLEKRQSKEETLSQGTFVKHLLNLISIDPNQDTVDSKNNVEIKDNNNLVFRKYYKAQRDEVIAKILVNCFSAVKKAFPIEWNDEDYILVKTTGYSGVMGSLKTLVPNGEKLANLTEDYFYKIFSRLKEKLKLKGEKLTSEVFASGATGEKKLSKQIVECMEECFPN